MLLDANSDDSEYRKIFEEKDIRSIGERAWDALRAHRISPTPRSFEVFYTLFSGANLTLEQQVRQLEAIGQPLTAGRVEALHEAHIGSRLSAAVAAGADDLADAAQRLVVQVARGGESLRHYGSALDHWRTRLNTNAGVEDLLRAVVALTAETEQASARNRELEMQLSTEVDRVARLREDLVQVRQEASTDALTGIPNRRAFEVKLRRAVSDASANSSAR